MSEITATIILAVALVLVLVVVPAINRRRAAHLCKCGHRRDEHDDEWGDCCMHSALSRPCSCLAFERRAIERKDNGDSYP